MCKLLRIMCYWSKINHAQNSIANLTFSIDYTKLQRLFRYKKKETDLLVNLLKSSG